MLYSRHDSLRALGLAAGLLALVASPRAAEALPVDDLWISEVMYNPAGWNDDGREWVELFNAGSTDIDLSGYSLGWGGADYTTGVVQLAGTIPSGAYFVLGGPTSDAANGNPSYDQIENFAPNLENGFWVSGGVALFDVDAVNVDATTVPVHAVIYGGLFFGNGNGLIDETGVPGAVNAPFVGGGTSVVFDGAGWAAEGTPTPGSGGLVQVPEATPSLLMLLGLVGLAAKGSSRRRATR